jgi:hypothetical protein
MTIGQLVECLFGKACALYGAYGDCTAYAQKGANYKTYGEMLTKMDFHCSGNQLLYNGYTGEQIYSEIFIGPTYYMRLKHMVKDKINYRATGKRSALTRQTNQGRANDGGLRIGEMERDGIMGHGLSYFLNESYMVRGDQYYMAVCNKTGTIAIYNPDKNLFLSPMSDGPLTFNRTAEGELILDVFSRFGRSFSLLRIPYALKLLIQELQVLNIQMRIITEENVDQLLNLSYQSKNLNKLINASETDFKDINELITHYKKELHTKIINANAVNNKVENKNAGLQNYLREVEPQKFEGIEMQENSDNKYAEARKEFADRLASDVDNDLHNDWYAEERNAFTAQLAADKAANTEPGWGDSPPAYADADWYPAAEREIKHYTPSPEKIWTSPTPAEHASPGYAPPDFNDQMLKEYWNKLTNEEQNQIIYLPEDQQEEATRNLIINRSQPPFKIPNYGSDGELNSIFAGLPRLEQIELLKLSHERQIYKLMKMANNEKETSSNDFSKLRIIIPEYKSSSEELYGSPELQMLAPAPANTPVTEEKTSETNNNDKKNVSGGNSSNIKKVTF